MAQRKSHGGHPPRKLAALPDADDLAAAAEMLRALGDPERLKLLLCLAQGELCVSELAEEGRENVTTVSARLKLLRAARLVRRRREARHVYYGLADEHVLTLIRNAVAHAAERG
jgi:ArsR family transcriptional regulator, lead/cadmium/zinc/bismuth-responsive transcriptional repressor